MSVLGTIARWVMRKSATFREVAREHERLLDRTRAFEDGISEMLKCPETKKWAIRVWCAAPGDKEAFSNALLEDKAWAVILGRDIAEKIKP